MTDTLRDCETEPWEGRAILHVDLDAFFAAVEQLDHPEWRGKPVIVGRSRQASVVSTCSYEARSSACARPCRLLARCNCARRRSGRGAAIALWRNVARGSRHLRR